MSRPWLLLLGLILVALNLRPALSSMSPLLGEVSQSLGLSAAKAGLLPTLPVLCLGLFAPTAPILARRFGAERVVLGILLTLAAGIILRSSFGEVGLFAGSLIAGASIGIIGVLLPGIVKRDFAKQAGAMTGVYTMALCLGAALAAGSTVPLSHYFGDSWSIGLGFWIVPDNAKPASVAVSPRPIRIDGSQPNTMYANDDCRPMYKVTCQASGSRSKPFTR